MEPLKDGYVECGCQLAADIFEQKMEILNVFTEIIENYYHYRGDILGVIQEVKQELCRGTGTTPPEKLMIDCCLHCRSGGYLTTEEQRAVVRNLIDAWEDPDIMYEELWFVSDVFYNSEEECAKAAQEMKHWLNLQQMSRLQTSPSSAPNPFKSLQLPCSNPGS